MFWKSVTRRLLANKSFLLINVTGLALGITACILIIQYVNFELSYDHFNKNINNIYRIVHDRYQQGKLVQHSTMTFSGISRAMKNEFPEVQDFSRVEPYRVEVMSFGDKKIADHRAVAVDNSFLSMFSYPLLIGDRKTALIEPNSLVLTEKLARSLSDNPRQLESLIGKAIIFDRDSVPYKITGICRDVPENSHLHFDLLMSYNSLYSKAGNNRWENSNFNFTEASFWHYIQLKPGTDYRSLEKKFATIVPKYMKDSKAAGNDEKFSLQPLKSAYLYSNFEFELGRTGNGVVVWSLAVIAAFILILACINYVNLSTAKSIERAREVGVRKVIGATKAMLVRQFLKESIVITIIALMVAFVFIQLVQNSFNGLIGHQLSLKYLFVKGSIGYAMSVGFLGVMLTSFFLSALYPAFVLSGFAPVKVLKGKFLHSAGGTQLRKYLVIGQFAVTIILLFGSLVVYRQMNYMSSQPLGYDIDQVLILRRPVLMPRNVPFRNTATNFISELQRLPNVSGAAVSGRIPGNELGKQNDVYRTDKVNAPKITVSNMGIDHHFLKLYKMQLVTGRNFEVTDYHDSISKVDRVIINESAADALGFSSAGESVGKPIKLFNRNWTIVGVVKDFHQKSLKYALEPTVLMPTLQGRYSTFSVKVETRNLSKTIADISALYAKFFPGNLFDHYFLDEEFQKRYAEERLFGQIFWIFAVLAIVIACLGLAGLALVSTTQRAKEIGVRKVLGASVPNIVLLFYGNLLKPVLMAAAIASPVAWWLMNSWLQDFAYRIDLSPWLFIAAGLFAIVIALMTVSFQTIRTANSNPVKSLRS